MRPRYARCSVQSVRRWCSTWRVWRTAVGVPTSDAPHAAGKPRAGQPAAGRAGTRLSRSLRGLDGGSGAGKRLAGPTFAVFGGQVRRGAPMQRGCFMLLYATPWHGSGSRWPRQRAARLRPSHPLRISSWLGGKRRTSQRDPTRGLITSTMSWRPSCAASRRSGPGGDAPDVGSRRASEFVRLSRSWHGCYRLVRRPHDPRPGGSAAGEGLVADADAANRTVRRWSRRVSLQEDLAGPKSKYRERGFRGHHGET